MARSILSLPKDTAFTRVSTSEEQDEQQQAQQQQQYNLSTSQAHHAALPWTTGVPSPPRILVPPPTLTSVPFTRSFYVSSAASTQSNGTNTTNNSNSNNNQLLMSPEASLYSTSSVQDWRYECRREAQQILPHLYLGPLAAAKDMAYLRKENITLLLAVRNSATARARLVSAAEQVNKDPFLRDRVKVESVDVSGNQELISSFPAAWNIITDHLYSFSPSDFPRYNADGAPTMPSNAGKTLVYCESGNERSAGVAAAYIMQYLGCNAVEAIQIIQGRRFCVCFDDSLKNLLAAYDPIWRARSEVYRFQNQDTNVQHGQITGGDGNRKPKRGVEETYDDEEMEDGNDDAARFEKRDGIAPFRDASDLSMMESS